jgi:hypothetical protein
MSEGLEAVRRRVELKDDAMMGESKGERTISQLRTQEVPHGRASNAAVERRAGHVGPGRRVADRVR